MLVGACDHCGGALGERGNVGRMICLMCAREPGPSRRWVDVAPEPSLPGTDQHEHRQAGSRRSAAIAKQEGRSQFGRRTDGRGPDRRGRDGWRWPKTHRKQRRRKELRSR